MSSEEIVTELDESFSHQSTGIVYPHIIVDTTNTAPLPVIIGNLEDGDVPIVYSENGVSYELARIEKSAVNLYRLLRVYPFTYVMSPEQSMPVSNAIDLMEALRWTQQLS